MKIFVTGGTGALGKFLLPQLLEKGHEVVALSRSADRAESIEKMGASAVIADPLSKEQLTAAVRRAEPEVIIHQLTALKGVENFKKLDENFALTNRFRTEVTDSLLAAARTIGTQRLIVQSYCGWPYARKGGPVKNEDDPLDPKPLEGFVKTLAAIRYMESKIHSVPTLQGLALRYGAFYGPGSAIGKGGAVVKLVKKRKLPIIGGGTGIWSFIHLKDAASATVAAVTSGEPGVYNIVDDEPAKVSAWLPVLAKAVGGKPPRKIPYWLGELLAGKGGVMMMTQIKGCSNAKAKRDLGWTPQFASWRRGFVEGLG
ncbi:MAG: NAD-dependent epimerase/dehydratase family protein [Gemmatimonadaceae bacterium]